MSGLPQQWLGVTGYHSSEKATFGQFAFSVKVVEKWNSIPTNIRKSGSFAVFKSASSFASYHLNVKDRNELQDYEN